jgi:hypothetical protein
MIFDLSPGTYSPIREKHRTEVTEGGIGLVREQGLVDTRVFGREIRQSGIGICPSALAFGRVFSEPDRNSGRALARRALLASWLLPSRLSNLLPAGGDNHSDDHQPGDQEANACADPKRVEHGEQEDKEQRSTP